MDKNRKHKHHKNSCADLLTQSVLNNAMTYDGFFPPDPILAVGPDSIITMVNTQLSVFEKETLQQTFNTDTFSLFPDSVNPGARRGSCLFRIVMTG